MGPPTNGLTDLMRESMSVSLMAIGLKQSGLLPPFKECKLRKDRGQRNETIPILIKTPIIGCGGGPKMQKKESPTEGERGGGSKTFHSYN